MIPRPINIATVGELKTFFRQMADSTPLHLIVNGQVAKAATFVVDNGECTIELAMPAIEPTPVEPTEDAPAA
jgi:hypothetical protein